MRRGQSWKSNTQRKDGKSVMDKELYEGSYKILKLLAVDCCPELREAALAIIKEEVKDADKIEAVESIIKLARFIDDKR